MSETAAWRAGTARTEITPTEPTWLAGYASRDKAAEGVEQPLYATAIALEDSDGNRVVLLGADVLGIPGAIGEQVAERCEAACGLAPEALVLVASHTHSGPVV